MFGVIVPLAASLARLVGEQSGGFHLHGKSSSGKTVALHPAASVQGAGLKIWRATENGIEASCAVHNDGSLLREQIHMADWRQTMRGTPP